MKMKIPILVSFLLSISISPLASANEEIANKVRQSVHDFGLNIMLTSIAEQQSANLPRRINRDIEMVSFQHFSSQHGNMMGLSLRHINLDSRTVLRDRWEEAIEAGKRVDASEMCSSPVHGTFIKEYGVLYRYVYHDQNMENLYQYDIDRRYCAEIGSN